MASQGMVIVTGGSRGIGAAICRKLASLGHPVAVNPDRALRRHARHHDWAIVDYRTTRRAGVGLPVAGAAAAGGAVAAGAAAAAAHWSGDRD